MIAFVFENRVCLSLCWGWFSCDFASGSVAFVCGDFNFTAENDPPTRIAIDNSTTKQNDEPQNHKYCRKSWAPLINALTELHQPEHTRIGSPHNAKNEKYYYTSRIDRIYASWAPWQIMNLRTHTYTFTPLAAVKKKTIATIPPFARAFSPKKNPLKTPRRL